MKVIVRVSAKPDKIEELKRIFAALAAPTRQEAGCVAWEVFQNLADPREFTFVEEWASAAALDAHWSTPHVQDALARGLPLLVASPDERRYAKIA
jgi:quinol monooxygenase YgiN